MPCERFRDALTDAGAGGPLPAALEAHLAACEACRAELLALRRALAVADAEMTELASAEPSPGLAARIRQAVDASETGGSARREGSWLALRFGWPWPAMAATAATAATLLVALALVLGRSTGPTSRSRVAADVAQPQPTDSAQVAEPTGEPVIPRDAVPAGPEGSAEAADPSSPGRDVAPRGDKPAEPEVLVPPGEGEVLLRFAALVRPRVVSSDSLLVADVSGPLTEPKAVEIQPLVIAPLDPAEPSGTD
jgi:hypothetical protein